VSLSILLLLLDGLFESKVLADSSSSLLVKLIGFNFIIEFPCLRFLLLDLRIFRYIQSKCLVSLVNELVLVGILVFSGNGPPDCLDMGLS